MTPATRKWIRRGGALALMYWIIRYYRRKMQINRAGKAVVITGCDSGFGRALALRLSASSPTGGFARVFAACLTDAGVASLRALERDTLCPLKLDVTDPRSLSRAAKRVGGELALRATPIRLWGLVNNAGVQRGSLFDLSGAADYEACANVNYLGMVRCCKAFLPLLRPKGAGAGDRGGRIVNVTSYTGYQALPGVTAYAASKHAAEAFTRGLGWELEPVWPGLRVISVAPGAHATPLYAAVPTTVPRATAQRDSATELYGKNYVAQVQSLLTRAAAPEAAGDPRHVVDALEDALASAHPPKRYTVGIDAWFMRFISCLPHAVHDTVWTLFSALLPTPAALASDGAGAGGRRRVLLDLMMSVWRWLAGLGRAPSSAVGDDAPPSVAK